MDAAEVRNCLCGTRLARDNSSGQCGRCRTEGRAHPGGPPAVPASFWTTASMREALQSWHIGNVIAAYRMHPWHATAPSQEVVAGWMGIDQGRLSRIENGSPIHDLVKLTAWAELLGVPEERLWFKLPVHRTAIAVRDDTLPAGAPRATTLLAELDLARLHADRTLSDGTAPARLDVIEERVGNHVTSYTRTPPGVVLEALVTDVREVHDLAAQRQPALAQGRLSESAAVLALLIADALMKFGEISRATYWYGTARMAADDTTNLELRALVRAQEAMLPYYYGRLERTVELARAAQLIAPARPCDATALAAAAEARALARLSDRAGAETALARAWDLVNAHERPSTDEAFQFNDKRLLMYASGTLTYLGDTTRARDIQRQALDCYRTDPELVIDPALIQLDAAVCHALDGTVDDACGLAVHTISELPAQHRTRIVLARAAAVAHAIPARHKDHRAVTSLRELVAASAEAGR